jgi:hypothetical protein
MILQALHADKRLKELGKQGRIIIKTSDTDVIVLCIYFYKQMTNTSETRSQYRWTKQHQGNMITIQMDKNNTSET